MSTPSAGYPLHRDAASPSDASLGVMLEQECPVYACSDYLGAPGRRRSKGREERVTTSDRAQLVDWCYHLVDRCRFRRDTVAVAANLADRFVGTPRGSAALRDCTQYQLVTITALYISIKLNEQIIFGSRDFAAACRGVYAPEDIEDMERTMLDALDWRLSPPTSLQLANQILSLMLPEERKTRLAPETWPALREAVARQTERAVRDYSIAIQRPSTVAAAAIMNALEDVASDEDFARLTEALVGVVKEYPFETRCLFDTKAQLRFFLNDDVATGSERTEESAVEEEALHPDHHFHHRLVQDCLDRALSSPKLVICDDAWDDASYATVY